ncbi:MAG: AAA family ATPase [Chloroflexia bacterium]|nr:AAA family ATPase [Chloroflexia bacterium]
MTASASLMTGPSPAVAPRQATTVYGAVGLIGDPFPQDPIAGTYVALGRQIAVLDGVRSWLASSDAEAPGLAVIAGPAGSGKTRLLEQLVLGIAGDDRLIGVVPAEDGPRSDAHLLRAATAALGGAPRGRTGLELTTELRAIFEDHRQDPLPPVLLIDDAALTGSQLEILRGVLTGPASVPDQTRVQIVLFGPPALPDRIARRRSLSGLTRYGATLSPLDAADARLLLDGRIAAMRDHGIPAEEPFISEPALEIMLAASAGNPGDLLRLAHTAVREAIATGGQRVDAATARAVTRAASTPGGPSFPPTIASGDAAIQTRLVLPGVDDASEPSASSRRRRQQR